MKVIFPAIWITGFGFGTFALLLGQFHDNSGAPTDGMKWIFGSMWLLGSAFIYWACIRLKRVRMDDEFLYISNYHKEIQIALRDVSGVSENRFVNIHPITVEFSRCTKFGDRIVFMPTTRWWGGWKSHPIVAELRDAAHRAGARLEG